MMMCSDDLVHYFQMPLTVSDLRIEIQRERAVCVISESARICLSQVQVRRLRTSEFVHV